MSAPQRRHFSLPRSLALPPPRPLPTSSDALCFVLQVAVCTEYILCTTQNFITTFGRDAALAARCSTHLLLSEPIMEQVIGSMLQGTPSLHYSRPIRPPGTR